MTSAVNIPITYAVGQTVEGTNPIVVIGPNGAGKTNLAVEIARTNGGDFISAIRYIAVPASIQMMRPEQANSELVNRLEEAISRPWLTSNEIEGLFAKLLAEDSSSAIRFRDGYLEAPGTQPENTKLMKLREMWTELFPGRSISFADYTPTASSIYRNPGSTYPAQRLSDGERVALFLAARVLDSNKSVIVIDEPEVHFHSRLSMRFWNEMEAVRPDCRFVYVTHDLNFALSRTGASFLIVMPQQEPNLVNLASDIPREVAEALLSAASFSIFARRIVFCEGREDGSIDVRIYRAWFNDAMTAVVPVDSCRNVIECVNAYNSSDLVIGVQALGIIDRDVWPAQFLSVASKKVLVLPVHEAESLLCVNGVFTSIAQYLQKSDPSGMYATFIQRAKAHIKEDIKIHQVSERFKRRCLGESERSINSLSSSSDLAKMRSDHIAGVSPNAWTNLPSAIMDEEVELVERALNGDEGEFLAVFLGKALLPLAAQVLGVRLDLYVDLVCKSLLASGSDTLHNTGLSIEEALVSYLPSRRLESDSTLEEGRTEGQ